ncbi:PhzF family phenazine biosynthesis protein [Henriciella aquimarina]|uniref:PhzF family phenazine biosynthesis protein n=1 Tax=Henriciella aquimarina TaxID=545261 RepID=UPI000A069450|nr:PhzF family phenazine biosynthesis protein [Henriciella aquimarina]
MARLPFYQIDAFASRPFEGNQACVMPLEAFLPDATLQAIAAENNVSETAYIVPKEDGGWALRWFTPGREVPLCGHATLASAHLLFDQLGFAGDEIAFDTVKSGRLTVTRGPEGRYEMDFPAPEVEQVEVSDDVAEMLGARPVEAWAGPYYAAIFENPEQIVSLEPNLERMKPMTVGQRDHNGCFGVLAPGGDGADITSRFFAPGSGIPEDPATGSWHCIVAAIMGARLNKPLDCFQAYPGRGARIGAELAGDRVKLRGDAVTVIEGTFTL